MYTFVSFLEDVEIFTRNRSIYNLAWIQVFFRTTHKNRKCLILHSNAIDETIHIYEKHYIKIFQNLQLAKDWMEQVQDPNDNLAGHQ